MQACTIIARNYFPQARVLARSFCEHHPDSSFTVLLLDETEAAGRSEDFDILSLDALGFPPGEVERMALIYNVLEFSTAVKPSLLRRLWRPNSDVVFYFDPDIEIFAPLYDLADLARSRGIVLTPHVLEPMKQDGRWPTESNIMGVGMYNLGFIAVGPGSESFLDWWALRLRRDCIIDPANMRFTDQRWIDFVPSLFSHHISRDPACNVAYWNLDQRKLTSTGTGYEVNGQPLRFFHYSGYDPERPDVLSKFQGDRPRVSLEREPAVARICHEYGDKLFAEGYAASKHEPYRYNSFGAGVPIDLAVRRLYRTALMKHEAGEGAAPPNPFLADTPTAFLEWLNYPLESATALITPYMLSLRGLDPHIKALYPDPLGRDAADFYLWFVDRASALEEAEGRSAFLPVVNPELREHLESPRVKKLRRMQNVVGRNIDFGANGGSGPYRLSGWSQAEAGFTWSIGQSAMVALPMSSPAGQLQLKATVSAFVHPPALPLQRVEVQVQGRKVAEWNVSKPKLFHAVIPPEATKAGGVLFVEFRTPDAASPRRMIQDSTDPRVLGLRVHNLTLAK